jgi:PAS domain S-box-containing protein
MAARLDVLLLEDGTSNADRIERALEEQGYRVRLEHLSDLDEFASRLHGRAAAGRAPDVVIVDGVRSLGRPVDPAALCLLLAPQAPCILVGGEVKAEPIARQLQEGVSCHVAPDRLDLLGSTIEAARKERSEAGSAQEEELPPEAAAFRLLARNSFDGVNLCEYDPVARRRRLVSCNERFVEMSGRTREELEEAENLDDLVEVIEQDDVGLPFLSRLALGVPTRGVASWRRRDGRENYFRWVGIPWRRGSGLYILGIDHDITEARRSRAALQEARERFELLVRTSQDGINVCSWEPEADRRRLLFCNDRFVEMSGYTREELEAADNLSDLVVPHDNIEDATRSWDRMLNGLAGGGLASWKRPDGRENYHEWSALPVRRGGRYEILGTDRDVTRHVQLERRLRAALRSLASSQAELGRLSPSAGTAEAAGPHTEGIDAVARAVRNDPYGRHDFREAAERLHISYAHFRRLFREQIGRPPHDYMLLWRMRRAAQELCDTDRPVKAVAAEAGYADPAEFSRLFKEKMGLSPTAYRQALGGG